MREDCDSKTWESDAHAGNNYTRLILEERREANDEKACPSEERAGKFKMGNQESRIERGDSQCTIGNHQSRSMCDTA